MKWKTPFITLDGFWAFWDKNSSADFEDDMEDIDVEIDMSSKKPTLLLPKTSYPLRSGA